MEITALILAAGQGTRMKSALPKVLHPLCGKPLIEHSMSIVSGLGTARPVVVIGHGAEAVQKTLGDRVRFVTQMEQLGTANAVQAAEAELAGKTDLVIVVSADMPLLTGRTIQRMAAVQQKNAGPFTMLTVHLKDSHGFGRVKRGADGGALAIVEEAQCTPEQLAMTELNVGAYCFRSNWLWDALRKIKKSPKGEYYLTDTLEIAVSAGLHVEALALDDPTEAIGINNRVHLAEAEAVMRKRINTAWMMEGVTMMDPASTYIEADVKIGRDTIIFPNTWIRGKTTIGENCEIGPNAIIQETRIGSGCTVLAAVMEYAEMDDGSEIGPFGHLRKGAHLGKGVHMGNFGEIKNSYLGPGTKMGHFSYIGDATIGEDVNIGAGTITCNFDGVHKHHTDIGDHVFVGSDTMLVAPLKLGEGAHTGAGAVVTHDVPPGETVVGVPARPLKK